MSHLSISRKEYEHLLMALASDLKIISDMGVDKAAARKLIGELMTVASDCRELFAKYRSHGEEAVSIKRHLGGKMVVESHSREQHDKYGMAA